MKEDWGLLGITFGIATLWMLPFYYLIKREQKSISQTFQETALQNWSLDLLTNGWILILGDNEESEAYIESLHIYRPTRLILLNAFHVDDDAKSKELLNKFLQNHDPQPTLLPAFFNIMTGEMSNANPKEKTEVTYQRLVFGNIFPETDKEDEEGEEDSYDTDFEESLLNLRVA